MATKFSSLFDQDTGNTMGLTFASEAMKSALAKAQEAKLVKVAENATSLLTAAETVNQSYLAALRNYRKLERQQKETLTKFTRALKYFTETGNFGPLYPYMPHQVQQVARNLGVDLPTAEEQQVPDSFKS